MSLECLILRQRSRILAMQIETCRAKFKKLVCDG
jgi:hypothetical protein